MCSYGKAWGCPGFSLLSVTFKPVCFYLILLEGQEEPPWSRKVGAQLHPL